VSGPGARRSGWQREADRRYPDAMDMVQPALGDGRWATVAWCGGLTVFLHRASEEAEKSFRWIDRLGCGHACWRDHELVDLAAPPPADRQDRAARRIAHFEACRNCAYVYSGRAPGAALGRARHPEEARA
jgi:hypothetical protein